MSRVSPLPKVAIIDFLKIVGELTTESATHTDPRPAAVFVLEGGFGVDVFHSITIQVCFQSRSLPRFFAGPPLHRRRDLAAFPRNTYKLVGGCLTSSNVPQEALALHSQIKFK